LSLAQCKALQAHISKKRPDLEESDFAPLHKLDNIGNHIALTFENFAKFLKEIGFDLICLLFCEECMDAMHNTHFPTNILRHGYEIYQNWENLNLKASWLLQLLKDQSTKFGTLAAFLHSEAEALKIQTSYNFSSSLEQVTELQTTIDRFF